MTAIQFIEKKNKLLKKYTGIRLVPKGQLKNVEFMELSTTNDIEACPYCRLYYADGCEECPMALADNNCKHTNSTYGEITYGTDYNGIVDETAHWAKKLRKLIKKYNKEKGK